MTSYGAVKEDISTSYVQASLNNRNRWVFNYIIIITIIISSKVIIILTIYLQTSVQCYQ